MKAAAVTAKHYERLEMMILRRSAQGMGTESKFSMSQDRERGTGGWRICKKGVGSPFFP